MPNQIVPDITPGATAATDTVLGVKSGGDDSLALLPYGADLAVLTAAAAAKLPLAGGTITGPLFIEEPTVDAHAATKLYVDTNTTDKLPLAGGTVTGALFVEEPTVDAHAATKLYVDTTASASGALLVVNDLSDLSDAPTARANLGLGTAAVLASTYFATAAQGATADAALQTVAVPGDITATGTPSASTWLNGAGGWSTPAGGGDMLASANLSELTNFGTARTNLGLGSAATTASTDYATAAQGATADTATQPGDLGTAAAQNVEAFATAAQGTTADTALQTVAVPADITATGTASATTFLRGDGAWAAAGLAGGDGDVIAYQPLLYRNDGRSTELTYTGDDLTQVLEKDGATTVKQTDLTYTTGKLTSVVELADSITVTTTLTYTGDKLTSTGRVVS